MRETTLEELAFLFGADNEEHRPVVLLGAGASFTSGVPMAGAMVNEIAKWTFARRERSTTPEHTYLRKSEWEQYLASQPWFDSSISRAEMYPLAVEHFLQPREFRREFFREILSRHREPSPGYDALAAMCARHLVSHFFTTNFDSLIEDSLLKQRPIVRAVDSINKAPPGDHAAFSPNRKAQVIYLHGAVETYTDSNLTTETLSLNPSLVTRIHSLVAYSPVIVVGYRGAERSVMNDFFEQARAISQDFCRGVYWCVRNPDDVHDNVRTLHEAIGDNLRLVRIDGFDELFGTLNRRLLSHSLRPRPREHASQPHSDMSVGGDTTPCKEAPIEDLDQALLRSTLTEYQDKVRNATFEDLADFLVEYDFASVVGGKVIAHFGLWLLFGADVTERLPQLKSSIRVGEKELRVFDGNLFTQFQQIKNLLLSPEINPELRIKGGEKSVTKTAYHTRALVELLVNHFVHRDYSSSEFSLIEISPGRSITFRTPGGLPSSVHSTLAPDGDGTFRPIKGIREHRNPLLADVFYGLNFMDRQGTGLVDVEAYAVEHLGSAEFRVDGSNSEVTSILFQAVSDSPSPGQTARGRESLVSFIANLLRIQTLPDKIHKLPLEKAYAKKRKLQTWDADFSQLPCFRPHEGYMVSFCDLAEYEEARRIGYMDYASADATEEWISDEDRRRVVVSLIGKQFEAYLHGFSGDGLCVNRLKRRAYFTPNEGDDRTIVWDSPSKKGIRRGVVKTRGASYECEGIAYSVEQFGDAWCIQIKPIYVFLKDDGVTPLSGIAQSKRQTRRFKFDRNPSVLQDLKFWVSYLGRGSEVVDIGGDPSALLLLKMELSEVTATSIPT